MKKAELSIRVKDDESPLGVASCPRRTVVLFDGHHLGHHLSYQRNCTLACLELGFRVILCSPCSESVGQWLSQKHPERAGDFRAFFFEPLQAPKSSRNFLKKWIALRWLIANIFLIRGTVLRIKKVESLPIASVVLLRAEPYVELAKYRVFHRFLRSIIPAPWSGIIFRSILRKEDQNLRRYLTDISRQNFAALNESDLDTIGKRGICQFPDITETEILPLDTNREKVRKKAKGRPIIFLFGFLSRRKGLLTFLEAAQSAMGSKYFFLVAGPVIEKEYSEDELNWVRKSAGWENVLLLDMHFSDEELNSLVSNSNVIFAAYENFSGSSNVLSKCAFFRKPVIVSKGELMEKRIASYQLGVVLENRSPENVIEAVNLALKMVDKKPFIDGARAYFALHNYERLLTVLNEVIDGKRPSHFRPRGMLFSAVRWLIFSLFGKEVAGAISGVLEYYRTGSLRDSFGGAFNGQRGRIKLIESIASAFPIDFIIETGTFRGATTEFLAAHFSTPILTIEINPRFYWYSKLRLRGSKNVDLRLGSSDVVLRTFARGTKTLARLPFCYLDAHWQDHLPLWGEIQVIFERWPNAIILVDDFKVPGDLGYGFDDYGPSKTLDVDTLKKNLHREYSLYFPRLSSSDETGYKRGMVVIAQSGEITRKLDRIELLRKGS